MFLGLPIRRTYDSLFSSYSNGLRNLIRERASTSPIKDAFSYFTRYYLLSYKLENSIRFLAAWITKVPCSIRLRNPFPCSAFSFTRIYLDVNKRIRC